MKIIFSGGGTLGPVTPLLAIHEILKKNYPGAEFLWVGTKNGPERALIEDAGIEFRSIASGKLRRYFSILNALDIFKLVIGYFQSIHLIWKQNPDLCVSAGGYTSVPLHWAASLFGVSSWIHQQDVRVTLSNKLMAPVARKVTTALESQLALFPKRKTEWIGNPVRLDILSGDMDKAHDLFHTDSKLPTVFATGGGTGSLRVNQLIVEAAGHLKDHANIIHLSGKERPQELSENAQKHLDHYQVHKFFSEEMKHAYAIADVVIARGGFGTITELAALKKASILIPKPGHQVENVRFLDDAGAVILVDEEVSDGLALAHTIKKILDKKDLREYMGDQLASLLPRATEEKVLEIANNLLS